MAEFHSGVVWFFFFFWFLVCFESESLSLSHLPFTATPWTACQAPLSVGFSRKEYWSGLRFWYLLNALCMMRIYVYDKKQISALKTYKKKDSFKALSSNSNSRNSSYILFKHIF